MLTDPALTKQYMFGCEAVTDWKVGSPVNWRGSHEGKDMVFVVGNVVTFRPNELLEYTTFDPFSTIENIPSNHVTMRCTLTPRGKGTLLELSQGDFSTVAEGTKRYADSHQGGGQILSKMKAVAEAVR